MTQYVQENKLNLQGLKCLIYTLIKITFILNAKILYFKVKL